MTRGVGRSGIRWGSGREQGVVVRPATLALLLAALVAVLAAPFGDAHKAAAAPGPFRPMLLFASDPGAILDGVVTDGSVVAWLETDGALVVRDLGSADERARLAGPARRGQLALSARLLVWVEHTAEGAAIRAWRLGEPEPFTIAAGPGERNSPAVGGATVVWRDKRHGDWDLYAYDLREQHEFPLVLDAANQGAVSVAGDRVVWEDHRAGNWDLYAYDVLERREYALTEGPDDDLAPALDSKTGDSVAFIRRGPAGGFGALLVRDLGSGQERTIVSGHGIARPALTGDLVVWEDWRAGAPNVYAYERETNREFALTRTEQARGPSLAGTTVAWLSKGQFTGRVTVVRLEPPRPTDPQDPPPVPDPDNRYFPETKHNLRGAFRTFWNLNGGLTVFGYPLTEAFEETDPEGVTRPVQYFERVKLQADPGDPSRVNIALLGVELSSGRDFPAVDAFSDTADRAYIAQTGHSLKGAFKVFWEAGGGETIFGYPISEELEEDGVTVQWFERARFELRPGPDGNPRVYLSQLGREALEERHGLPGVRHDGPDR
jgi:beta propeller repeat protein